ncbi:MAG TPA: phage portal protein [Longimicrobiaceae bacterium]|nr:phage portal protein [Longimicrobiaceae bacterium]
MKLAPAVPRASTLDRVVSWLNPAAGLRRHQARAQLALTGGYGGGGYTGASSTRKALKNFNPRAGSGTSDINPDLVPLRSRTRDLSRNNPIGSAAIDTPVRHVIGTGLWPQPRLDYEALGISEAQAAAVARKMERIWTAWAESTACDVTGQSTFAQLQALIYRSILDSGDAGVLRRWKPRRWASYGVCLQVIEADRISNPREAADTDEISAGVETDADGEPLAYHVLRAHPGDTTWGALGVKEWARVPARGEETHLQEMLLPFPISRPSQRRGVPFLAPVIELIKQLGTYMDAEVDAAVVSAFFTAFITTTPDPEGEPGTAPLAGAGVDDDAGVSAEAGEIEMGSGAVVGLAPGEDVRLAAPTRPNVAFDGFVTAISTLLGAAVGIPYEVLLKRFQNSYSASRAALLDAWCTFALSRFWFGSLVCNPIREWVLYEAVARGELHAPGFLSSPARRQLWLACDWTGDAAGEIDPARAALAAKLRMELFLSTLQQETMAMTGRDWERNLEQAAKELERRQYLKLATAADRTAAEIAALLATEKE